MTVRNALEVATLTDAGVVRSFNEDSIASELDLGLAVVADGMGGYKAGDVASGMVTSILLDEVKRRIREVHDGSSIEEILRDAVLKANQSIYKVSQANPQYQGMGATLVATLFYDNQLYFIHVGDSRLYLLRQGKLKALTQDHSILQEQMGAGLISSEDAKASHNRNLVTRAVGVESVVECEVERQVVQPGDIYLLCSDGLNDMVDDVDIELALQALQANIPLCARQLVMMANDNGGHDNISVALVKVLKSFPADDQPKGLLNRLFGWL